MKSSTRRTVIFGIFAHPDDETFGPSATFLKLVSQGADLHLIVVTNGQHGTSAGQVDNLGKTRLAEWRAAGQALGAQSMHALDFEDGRLCNNDYQLILHQIEAKVLATLAVYSEPLTVKFVTFDVDGFTGHLDHIIVSLAVTKLFYVISDKLSKSVECQELAYFCLSKDQAPAPDLDYFVFMPAGKNADYINRTEDVSEFLPKKYAIMRLHKSQQKDAEMFIAKGDAFHQRDHFHIITRDTA